MNKNILYVILAVIVLVGISFWLDGENSSAPTISPQPSVSPTNGNELERELDASLQGDIDVEFRQLDQDASVL